MSRRNVLIASCIASLAVGVSACVPDEEAARIRTWRIANECDFAVGVHLGDPIRDGNEEMERANQYVDAGESVELSGAVNSSAHLEVWAWSRDRADRSIFQIFVDRDGEDLTLEGSDCEFMESG